jgi:DNA-binding transcriptional regulator YiaG
VSAYYAAWRGFVAEVRGACAKLRGVLPAHEVEAFVGRLSEAAVGPSVEALEALAGRLEEFAAARPGQARREGRRAVATAERAAAGEKRPGRWVTAAEFAAFAGVSVQTLANWRWKDRRAGRDGPGPGKPIYRRFGRAVRYFLPEE